MSRGTGDRMVKVIVVVDVKETASGYTIRAREEKDNDDADSGPGS
jgi:hypothetical protein